MNITVTSDVVASSHHLAANHIIDTLDPIKLGENTSIAYPEEIVCATVDDVTLSHPLVTRIIDTPKPIELDESTTTLLAI